LLNFSPQARVSHRRHQLRPAVDECRDDPILTSASSTRRACAKHSQTYRTALTVNQGSRGSDFGWPGASNLAQAEPEPDEVNLCRGVSPPAFLPRLKTLVPAQPGRFRLAGHIARSRSKVAVFEP
jgi:hypothetical protein